MGSEEDAVFSDDVVQKLNRVVQGLMKAGFLTTVLGNKAKEFINAGDRFVIYALYQYDSEPGALTSYLTYKQSDDDKIRKEVKGIRRNIQRRKSIDAFMNERKEVLALARKQHADGIQKVKDTKEAAAVAAAAARQAELDKANGETNDGDGESGEGAGGKTRHQTNKPRWLLLYEAKFKSYNDLLYEDGSDSAKVVSAAAAFQSK